MAKKIMGTTEIKFPAIVKRNNGDDFEIESHVFTVQEAIQFFQSSDFFGSKVKTIYEIYLTGEMQNDEIKKFFSMFGSPSMPLVALGFYPSNKIERLEAGTSLYSTFIALAFSENVLSLAPRAFASSSDLKTVSIKDGMKEIGEYAFQYCSSLETVNIPASVEKIGSLAFDMCQLVKFNVDKSNQNYSSKDGALLTKDGSEIILLACEEEVLRIPDGVKVIGENSIKGYKHVREIILPDSIEKIGVLAFFEMYALRKITLSKNLKIIENSIFCHCDNLKEVILPQENKYFTLEDGIVYNELPRPKGRGIVLISKSFPTI